MKPKIVVGLVIIIGVLVFLILGSFKESAVYYLTIPELLAKNPQPVGSGLRVTGYPLAESIVWNPAEIEVSFTLAEAGESLRVVYKGTMPDQLADAQQVVAEGHLDSSGVFYASKLLLKCPSKYETGESDPQNRGY
jgi:cytochrome c-type biogenesis protein CcmE